MFEPDPQQAEALAHVRGPLLVTGGPGTGKTSVLRERFARLIRAGADPERVALVVGSRQARRATRSALVRDLPTSLPDLNVLTIHGLAFHVVNERFAELRYARPPEILSAADQFSRVRELLRGEDPAGWPAYGSMLALRGFADEVRQFLLRAQEALLSPDDIEARARGAGLTGWLELARFYRRYLQVLDGEGAVDFAGLVEQAAASAGRDEPLLDHLLVDDFQDTTFGAEALLAALRAESLVVAGDPGAHVFSFRGTTDVPIVRFTERFAGASVVELSMPHRGDSVAVDARAAAHTSEEYVAVARELRRAHVDDGVPWDELAVVVRRHDARLGGLLRALDDAGIPRVLPEGGLSLLIEPATGPYVNALRWLVRPEQRDDLVETLLTSDLARLSPAEARGLVRSARAAGERPGAALDQVEGLGAGAAAGVTALREGLVRAEPLAERSVLDAFRVLWRDLPCSARLVAEAEGGSIDARRDLDAVLVLSRAVARAAESADPSTSAFLASLESGDEGPGPAPDGSGDDGAVRVLTAHGTVGREFDTVVVAGAVEGNFPSLSRPEPMFDLETLGSPVSQSERNRARLEDERRLFRLVTGRARRRVLLTASDEHDPEAGLTARSRFADDLGVRWRPVPPGPYEDPLTTVEATAAWRRTLADHGAAPAERLASLEGLLALGADPLTWWFQREWTDTGRPLRDHVRVSASRLSTLDNCELQFVLGEELGLDTSSSYYAWVGQTVHGIIEDCERGDLVRDLDALVAAAEDRWNPDVFPSMAISETFRRLVVERMLPAWFEEYGGEPALRAEERFEFDFEDATVSGVIDRIGKAEPAGSQITDYKTGRKRGGDADENLQLGIYYLAVHEAENLTEFLPVRGIELAFVRDVEWRAGGIARQSKAFTASDEPEYEAVLRETLRELIGRVRAIYETELIKPNPGANCRYCRFQPLCPLFPEAADLFPARAEVAPA